MSNTTGATLTGVGTGAASGAGIGSAVTPGIGTIVGAVAGAIVGGVAGHATAKDNQKLRDKEVERIQKREDTAQTRSALDSMSAGIDPRLAGVSPAGSAGVSPVQSAQPDVNQIPSALSNLGGQILEHVKLNSEANQFMSQKYQEFLQQGEENLAKIDSEISATIERSATTFESSSDDVKKFDSQFVQKANDISRRLSQNKRVSNEVYDKWRALKSAKRSARASAAKELLKAYSVSDTYTGGFNLGVGGDQGVSAGVNLGGTHVVEENKSERKTTSAEIGGENGSDVEGAGEKSKGHELTAEEARELAKELTSATMMELSNSNHFSYNEKDISSRMEWQHLLMSLYERKARYESRVSIAPHEFYSEYYPDVYNLIKKFKFPK